MILVKAKKNIGYNKKEVLAIGLIIVKRET